MQSNQWKKGEGPHLEEPYVLQGKQRTIIETHERTNWLNNQDLMLREMLQYSFFKRANKTPPK